MPDLLALVERLDKLHKEATPGEWRTSMTGYSIKTNANTYPLIVMAVHGGAQASANTVEHFYRNAVKCCRHCGGELVRKPGETTQNWTKRRYCNAACGYAKRTINTTCVECGEKAVTKGRCDKHYRERLFLKGSGRRRRLNESQRERHKRERHEFADWYLRVLYKVPKDASPAVYETLRVHAKLRRALGMGKGRLGR